MSNLLARGRIGKKAVFWGSWALRIALCAWIIFAGVTFGRDIRELRALQAEGHSVNAQVIGRDRLSQSTRMGRVHYAFRQGLLATVDSFPVPRTEYSNFWTGRMVPITYLPGQPSVHRLGSVDNRIVFSHELQAGLFVIFGLLALGLPLLALEATRLQAR